MRSKNALYNILFSFFLQFVIILNGFIVPKIIITSFGSNVNGLISSITQFLGYIVLLESGFGPVVKAALYKPIAKKNKEEIGLILRESERFFRKIAFFFLLTFFYPFLFIHDFSFIYTASLILIISISTFAEYYFGMTYKLYLNACQKNYVISGIQICTYILSMVAIIFMAKIGVSIQIIKLVSSFIFILRPVLQNLYVKKRYAFYLKNLEGTYALKQKWSGLFQHIASVIHNNTDITLLTLFGTLKDISIYSVYFLVVKGVKAIIQAFTAGIDALFGDMLAKKEMENLKKKFNLYEIIYFALCSIFYGCTMVLIVPFISVYTRDVLDANYIQPIFAILLVLGEFVWSIRQPYNELIKAAGHFKETQMGAFVEAVVNILISTLLVWKFGLIGVAIGTFLAMLIRSIEFIIHSNRFIMNRSVKESGKKIVILFVEFLFISIVGKQFILFPNSSYFYFCINAILVFIMSSFFVFIMHVFIYKKELRELFYLLPFIRKKM